MPNTFTLINPPTGFTISPSGVLSIDAQAPSFSGNIVAACTNGISSTTATIAVNWTKPTTLPMFSETGQLKATSRSRASMIQMNQFYEVLGASGGSRASMEPITINLMTTKSRSTASMALAPTDPQITAAGLTWGASFWTTGFGSYVPSYASAKYVEVYYPLGPPPTDVTSLVCKPAIQAELLTSVRIAFSDSSLIYFDCLNGNNEAGIYSALYYFEKP